MTSPARGGLVDYRGGCFTCTSEYFTRNVMGLAAQHAERHPDHDVWCELGYSWTWGPQARLRNEQQRAARTPPA